MDKIKFYSKHILTKSQLRSLIFIEVVIGVVFSAFSLFIFFFISNAVLDKQTIFIDRSVSGLILSLRNPFITNIMMFFSYMGEQIIIAGAAITLAILAKRRHKKETFIFLLLLIMGIGFTTLLKTLFKIPRPNGFELLYLDSYSYPSGHALNSFLFYGTISYFTYHFTKNKTITAFVFVANLVIVLLIGVSRVYLGVHHPSDVVAGYAAAFWLFVTIILIDKTVDYFKLIKETSKG